ncbi:MAG: PKD domain-containing protein [Desulfuromonadaceae bacterium]|nr:PKD domain-containing protein [Desulfuromonadaceae bacterium]MDD2853997.1 PKD domain-containing protein [Desulfuromonadaceae bacterium]
MKSGYLFTLGFLLATMLTLFTGCGSNSAATNTSKSNGTGSITAKLIWSDDSSISETKSTAKAADGVVTVRIIVSGTGFSDIQKDFPAVDTGGVIDEVPAGGGRTLKAHGLNSNGVVIYQGEISNITVQAGKLTDIGVIEMLSVNVAPMANAGANQSVISGSIVTLNGSGSSDANGDLLTYSWTFSSKPAGSSTVLSATAVANPTFTADVTGTYILALVVNDGTANSSAASVTVTASDANAAPVANAGANQSVISGSIVTLNGSGSSDANGDLLTYSWGFTSKPVGSSATLSATAALNPTFTADLAGNYVLSLVVNDGSLNSAAASVTITATIGYPDLIISNIECPMFGGAMPISFDIVNTGSVTALGPIEYVPSWKYLSTDVKTYIGNIPADSSIHIETLSDCYPADNNSVVVDPNNLITESDETNNSTGF